MKYKVNDTIMYDARRVCRITEISTKSVKGNSVEYYILKPLYDEKAVLFVPVDNEVAVAKMRPLLSAGAIYGLFEAMPEKDTLWIDDENARRARYKNILAEGDRTELLNLIRTLHTRQQTRRSKGQLPSAGDNFMKEAERVLHEEFVHVLDIEHNEVLPFILGQIRTGNDGRNQSGRAV